MTVRCELHQFADTLPYPAAEALLEYARWLAVHESDRLTEAERHDGRMPEAALGTPRSLEELLNELLGDRDRTKSWEVRRPTPLLTADSVGASNAGYHRLNTEASSSFRTLARTCSSR
jgi:hypothetical protein